MPDNGGVVACAGEVAAAFVDWINPLLGAEIEEAPDMPRRPSTLTEGLRLRAAEITKKFGLALPLRADLVLTQAQYLHADHSLAKAIEGAF